MKRNKFNLRNVVAVAICLVGLMAFVGCENKDDFADNPLVGKWVTVGNDHNHIEDGRIIVFTEDLRVEQYFDHIIPDVVVNYSIYGSNITFVPYPYRGGPTFEFILSSNSLTIKLFSRPFAIDAGPRFDVHFTRIE